MTQVSTYHRNGQLRATYENFLGFWLLLKGFSQCHSLEKDVFGGACPAFSVMHSC